MFSSFEKLDLSVKQCCGAQKLAPCVQAANVIFHLFFVCLVFFPHQRYISSCQPAKADLLARRGSLFKHGI